MSIYRRGGTWWYDFTIRGERYRGTTIATRKSEAAAIEASLKHQALTEGLINRRPPRLLDFIPEFLTWNSEREEAEQLKAKTVRYYKFGCQLLKKTPLSKMTLDRINGDEIQAVKLPGSNSYRNQALRTLSRILSYAETKKIIVRAPSIPLYHELGRESVIDAEDEAAITSESSALIRDAVWIMKDCGLRRDEVARMEIDWLDFHAHTINVPNGKSDNARREVPISQRVEAALMVRALGRKSGYVFPSKRSKSGHVHPDSLSHGFAGARDKAGVAHSIVLYSGRHTFGTDAYDGTKNPKLVAKAMGHSTTKMTERYVHPDQLDQIREVIEERNQAVGGGSLRLVKR